ncbi:hypothetical protein [Thermomonospora umbrina]|uniref:Nitroreductase family protein n=1 Tax=Thermomonospora umbrina TaxID=111806 RepID=A0A3D9SKK2_9ACTN|nr:hypothetical protein [Thermomonospora umbrina]REE96439.1 hypothetical protein DFJ69_1875 [Thermomonospora umbrina]
MSRFEEDARLAVEAARWAPSPFGRRPWRFRIGDRRIGVRADAGRALDVADPQGREMLIGCGAALHTLALTLRHLGHAPRVRLLPDPDLPFLLADIDVPEGGGDPGEETERLYEQVEPRHGDRGVFRPDPVPAGLPATLREEAGREGVTLRAVTEPRDRDALGALAGAADHLEPYVPGRDPARSRGWGLPEVWGRPGTGLVVLLTTPEDSPAAWLGTGLALQRVLLRARAEGASAAFHTHVLELPELRELIRVRLCGGRFPQVLLRLGLLDPEQVPPRRPADALVQEDY